MRTNAAAGRHLAGIILLMRRRLATILVVLSLLATLAAAALWLRGLRTNDQLGVRSKGGRACDLYCGSRAITFSTFTPWPRDDEPMTWHSQLSPGIRVPAYTLGFNPGQLTQRRILGVQIHHGPAELVFFDDWERSSPTAWKFKPPFTPVQTLLVSVPHWLLLAVAAFPALLILPPRIHRRLRTRRRLRLGLCPTCGYDLRASPGRCPECGGAAPPHHTG
jgi:hypothetical protein